MIEPVLSGALLALAAAVLEVPGTPERILEVGCGEGDGALYLTREYPAARVRGVDSSADAVRAAVARVGLDPEGRIAFKRGGPGALPFPDGLFDLVALSSGPLRAGELARVLRPGGHLVLIGSPWLARRRLARGGFEPVAAGDAGDSFLVARHRGAA